MNVRCWQVFLCGLCVGALSCASTLRSASSGEIGCPPEEVQVHDMKRGWASATWTATCRGRTFYCSGGGKDISCHEDMAQAAYARPYGPPVYPPPMAPMADPTSQVVSFLYELRIRNYPLAGSRMTLSYAGAHGYNGLQAAVERVPELMQHSDADAPRNQAMALTPGPAMITVQRGTLTTPGGAVPFAVELRFEAGTFHISRLWVRDEEVLSDGSSRPGP